MLDLFLGRVKEDREDAVSSAPTMVLCAEGLLGLGRGPGSLVARWCSGLARVENNDPANDGLWTPKPGRDPSTGVRISPGLPNLQRASPRDGLIVKRELAGQSRVGRGERL